MQRFRVIRRDWTGTSRGLDRDDWPPPSPGWSPLPQHAVWLDPPGDWFVDVPSLAWLLRMADLQGCDLRIRPAVGPDDVPTLHVEPWPDTDFLRALGLTTKA